MEKMNTKPLVSVIIPAYNTGRYIRNALDSIVKQEYNNIEVVVVDDGSSDNTCDVAEECLSHQNFPYRIIRQGNGGVSKARNEGLRCARGEWVLFLDSDDFMADNMVSSLLESAVNAGAECAFCDYRLVYEGDVGGQSCYNKGSRAFDRDALKWGYLNREFQMVVPSTLIRKDIAEALSFDEKCPYSEDTLYTWNLIYKVKKAVYVISDMYNYFVREGSKQHSLTPEHCIKSIERYHVAMLILMEHNKEDINFIRLIEPKFVLGAFHVLSRCVPYKSFMQTRKRVGTNMIKSIVFKADLKLTLYAILFRFCPVVYYKISQ